MKKLLFIAIAVVSLASCKKDYTCTCTDTGFSYTYIMTESKKGAAYAACEGKGIGPITDEAGVAYPASTTTCTIK